MFKVKNNNTRTTPLNRFGVFIANFEPISHLFLVLLCLILNKHMLVQFRRLCYVIPRFYSLRVKTLTKEAVSERMGQVLGATLCKRTDFANYSQPTGMNV